MEVLAGLRTKQGLRSEGGGLDRSGAGTAMSRGTNSPADEEECSFARHQLRYRSIDSDGVSLMDIVIPSATSIGLFAVAATLLLLTPGPAVLYIVARSVEQGRLSALLASSALAFAAVKFAGAGYLIYMGVRRILKRTGAVPTAARS
jgi:hypothetical protein